MWKMWRKNSRKVELMTYQSVAGQFFPESETEQKEMVREFLKTAKKIKVPGKIKALVVPHAGWVYSGIVAAAGYRQIQNVKIKMQNDNAKFKIILVGPSHREYFSGIKEEVCDHSVEVQLPFLREVLPSAKTIPVVYGEITPQDLAVEIEKKLDTESLIIISSDLSHYYPYDLAVEIDSRANKYIPKLNIKKVEKEAEACGKTGILALMSVAEKLNWKGKLLDYKNSGDTAGDKDSVVGYGCYCFYV